ncbi:MAG: hypothetical protein F6K42_27725 [Leptolyngbya sp. SIO1D8]|nr:hypothetical protein [Leptolyngbya sp. SIO1D8]
MPGNENQGVRQADPCNVFGVVYIEPVKKRADYIVYEEKTEAFADLRVFREENKLLADDTGLWHFTDQRAFADFTVYIQDEPSNADFTIFYIDVISYAGCD